MSLANEQIFLYLSQYAYQPIIVYTSVCLIMLAGSFGFPLPEEVALISVGIFAYMARHPDIFIPPETGMQGIDAYQAAAVCFFAVLFSDTLVFFLGRKFGPRLLNVRLISRLIKPESLAHIEKWTAKYGMWAAGVFRFTPGLRFPGFWTCGMAKLSPFRFLLVDGIAAMISVPTQVILVATYGENILVILKEVKFVIFIALLCFLLWWGTVKYIAWRKNSNGNSNGGGRSGKTKSGVF
jgi:membrane protein DedA with SNARE-associated domain